MVAAKAVVLTSEPKWVNKSSCPY